MNSNFTEIKPAVLMDIYGKAHWLKHNRTGLQIVFIKCNTRENHFEYVINTPGTNDYGTPHLLMYALNYRRNRFRKRDEISTSICSLQGVTFYRASCHSFDDFIEYLSEWGKNLFLTQIDPEEFIKEIRSRFSDSYPSNISNREIIAGTNRHNNVFYTIDCQRRNALLDAGLGDSSFKSYPRDFEHLLNSTSNQLKEYFIKYYTPSNSTLIIFSSSPMDSLLDILDKRCFSKLPVKTDPPFISPCFTDIKETVFSTMTVPYSGDNEEKYLFVMRLRYHPENPNEDIFLNNLLNLLTWDKNINSLSEQLNKVNLAEHINIIQNPSRYANFLAIEITNPYIHDQVQIEKTICRCIKEAVRKSCNPQTIRPYAIESLKESQLTLKKISKLIRNGLLYHQPLLFLASKNSMNSLKGKKLSDIQKMFSNAAEKYLLHNTEKVLFSVISDKQPSVNEPDEEELPFLNLDELMPEESIKNSLAVNKKTLPHDDREIQYTHMIIDDGRRHKH